MTINVESLGRRSWGYWCSLGPLQLQKKELSQVTMYGEAQTGQFAIFKLNGMVLVPIF